MNWPFLHKKRLRVSYQDRTSSFSEGSVYYLQNYIRSFIYLVIAIFGCLALIRVLFAESGFHFETSVRLFSRVTALRGNKVALVKMRKIDAVFIL